MPANGTDSDGEGSGRKSKGNRKNEHSGFFGSGSSKGKESGLADWASVDPLTIQRLVSTVALRGGAVRLGYSRDGNAYAIGLYFDGDHRTVYAGPHDEVTELMITWIEKYETLPPAF